MTNKVIAVVVTVLILVIAAQVYYTYHRSKQVEQLGQGGNVVTPQGPYLKFQNPSFKVPRLWDTDPFNDDRNPFWEMQRMQNEMNKIFGDMRSQ